MRERVVRPWKQKEEEQKKRKKKEEKRKNKLKRRTKREPGGDYWRKRIGLGEGEINGETCDFKWARNFVSG